MGKKRKKLEIDLADPHCIKRVLATEWLRLTFMDQFGLDDAVKVMRRVIEEQASQRVGIDPQDAVTEFERQRKEWAVLGMLEAAEPFLEPEEHANLRHVLWDWRTA